MKVVALTTVSGPYIVARYSAFSRLANNCEFCLIELGETSKIYQWESENSSVPYNRVVLSKRSAEEHSPILLSKKIFAVLDDHQPDCLVICGYGVPGMLQALFWCVKNHRPAVLLSESIEADFTRKRWREAIKRRIVKQFQSALVGGVPHREYLSKLGFPKDMIFLGYDVVGNDDFSPEKIKMLPSPLNSPYFLAVNRFVQKKNISGLLEAYRAYSQKSGSKAWDLVLCGDGDQRLQIEEKINKYGLDDSVHLPGFLQHKELLPYYAHADCFVHASITEQWGLVVNEAMASGLPVLVSERCGCAPDLVVNGQNGFTFDPNNVDELANYMLRISATDCDRDAMGHASLEIISRWTPETFARGLSAAIDAAVSSKVSSTTWWDRVLLQMLSYR